MTAVSTVTLAAGEVLAKDPQGPEFGKASPLGLLIVLVLLAGTVFLIWSMNRQLRKLPKTFDPDHPGPDQQADEGTDQGGTGAEPHASDDPPASDARTPGAHKAGPSTPAD
ncbi:hypothetical protein [Williamsia sterculiae]|uniref:Uncharacterized protein n=1 Tax=Williamsia sterculiae TaxID=1344003 RepID=A0A1N7DRV5_9NOCA|nr:hypothetical protein [Williamsia sterculiae]SIR78564.1 hypothetical protein SAMN05445060_0856 [Williamsia sterculiae]